jgi:hypothetical protein
MGVCLQGGQWNTEFVEIPADTPDDQVEAVARLAVLKIAESWQDTCLVGSWLYNSMDDECPEVESDPEAQRPGEQEIESEVR